MSMSLAHLPSPRGVFLILYLTSLSSVAGTAAPLSPDWQARWEEDLRFAQAKAAEQHPNLFHQLSHEDWNAEFDSLIARLPALEHHEVVVELARIVARVGDGHTRLTLPLGPGIEFMQGHSRTPAPNVPELQLHQFPVRFSVDSGGVHVRRIAAVGRDALGGRVRKLGVLDIGAAIEAVAPTIRRDNAMQVQHHLPMHLALAEVLHARGVIEDVRALPLEVIHADGRTASLTLHAVEHAESVEWLDARDTAGQATPPYLRHPERRFWLEHLDDSSTVYFQFNEVYNEEDESLRDFATRLETYLAEHRVENLVIDLRRNRGGNGRLMRPLVRSIIRSEVDRTGHLFVLAGRATFSAAMMFALELEKHTRALFVGEPTGSSTNHYGDARKIRLPHTGLTLRVSTLVWQYDPTDVRDAILPHIPVELTHADYQENRDPVLEEVLAIIASRAANEGAVAGSWRGVASMGLNAFDMRLNVTPFATGDVTVELPELEVHTEASGVAIEARKVTFGFEFQNEPVRVRTTVAGDWMIGEGDYRTVPFSIVLKRSSP